MKEQYQKAFYLAIITIVYNIIEGIISVFAGIHDKSLSLFGFGLDSFVEMISAIGIAHMIIRSMKNEDTDKSYFEKTALLITGWGFYILAGGLVLNAAYNIYMGYKPDTTVWGLVISVISIAVMWVLVRQKTKTGKALCSSAILADAECAKVCMYMSIILLASSAIYELTKFAYIDSIGAIGIAYFSYKEGKECFEEIQELNEEK